MFVVSEPEHAVFPVTHDDDVAVVDDDDVGA